MLINARVTLAGLARTALFLLVLTFLIVTKMGIALIVVCVHAMKGGVVWIAQLQYAKSVVEVTEFAQEPMCVHVLMGGVVHIATARRILQV